MKAVYYTEMGPAKQVLTLDEVETPVAADGEVLVRLATSGVNPSDAKLCAGMRPGGMPFSRIIPHSDGAGSIEAVGAGVDPARVGEPVWIWNGQWQRANGTAAEYISLPSQQAVSLPSRVDMAVGASLGIPAVTAAHVVHQGEGTPNSILVNGANGTVGRLAVQFAAKTGANVIATTGDLSDADRLKDLGAQHVVSYRDPEVAKQIIAANDGAFVDHIAEVEFGANIGFDAEVIAPHGRIVAYGSQLNMSPIMPFGALMFKNVTLVAALVYLLNDADRQAATQRVNAALAEGWLNVPVDRVYDFADCAAAHEAVLSGARDGSVVISCSA